MVWGAFEGDLASSQGYMVGCTIVKEGANTHCCCGRALQVEESLSGLPCIGEWPLRVVVEDGACGSGHVSSGTRRVVFGPE